MAMTEDFSALWLEAARDLKCSSKWPSARSSPAKPLMKMFQARKLKKTAYIQKLVPGCRLSSRYGMRNHPILHIRRLHTGLDLSAPKGTPVKAWKDGVVVKAKSSGGYGKLIVVRHTDGSETYYAHLRGFNVKKGDKVDAGDQIGEVGSTGMSTGPHLHFEVRVGGQAINPLENFNK